MPRFMGSRWVGRLVAPVVLAGGVLAVSATPAAADESAPRVTAAVRTSPAQASPLDPVRVELDVEDSVGPGSGVVSVAVQWNLVDGSGARVASLVSDTGLSVPADSAHVLGVALVGRWQASGRYQAVQIQVRDGINNLTIYHRDGTVTVQPGSVPAPPGGIDLAALDVEVVNAESDAASPVVSSLRVERTEVTAGTPVVLRYDANDDRSGVAEVSVEWAGPNNQRLRSYIDPALAAAGLASALLPIGAGEGVWQARFVAMRDAANNSWIANRGGGGSAFPEGVRQHAPQTPLDLAALDITVTAVAPDTASPVLSGVQRRGPSTLRPGDDLVIDYRVVDASPVHEASFTFRDQAGHFFDVSRRCAAEFGTAVIAVPAGVTAGPVQLVMAVALDVVGNQHSYRRDGLENDGTGDWRPSSVDLSSSDFVLEPGPSSYVGVPRTGNACANVALPLTLPESVDPGTVVDVVGSVLKEEVAVTTGTVAVFTQPVDGPASLVATVPVDASGGWSTTQVVDRDVRFVARYLGSAQSGGALPGTGEFRLVRTTSTAGPTASPEPMTAGPTAGPTTAPTAAPTASPAPAPTASPSASPRPVLKTQTLALTTLRTTVTAGRAFSMLATLRPVRGGVIVELQVPVGSGWRTVRSVRTVSTGKATLMTVPAKGIRRYRVVVRAGSAYALAVSRVLTVTAR